MPSRNIKMYRYRRGAYSVLVSVVDDDHTVFSEINVPDGTEAAVQARLLVDAEREAMKIHNEKVEKSWSNLTQK